MSAERDLTERDYELLSAYIDGALTDSEQSALETRLQADAALRRELDALRQTVALIRALPPLTAPRSFTLTPRMVAPSRVLIFPATTAFTALSAVAAVALVVFGLLLTLSSGTPASAPPSTLAQIAQLPSATVAPTTGAAFDQMTLTQETRQRGDFTAEATELPPMGGGSQSFPQPPPSVSAPFAPTLDTRAELSLQTNQALQSAPTHAAAAGLMQAEGESDDEIGAAAASEPDLDAMQFAAPAQPEAYAPAEEAAGRDMQPMDTSVAALPTLMLQAQERPAEESAAAGAMADMMGKASPEVPPSAGEEAQAPAPAPMMEAAVIAATSTPRPTATPSPTLTPSVTSSPTATPSDTPTPTLTATPTPPVSLPSVSGGTLGLAVIVVGVGLLILSILTVIARRRSR